MGLTIFASLTNSKGLGKVLQFDGLGLKFTVLPTAETLGEPFLTKQAAYFLEDVEAAAKVRLETDSVLLKSLKAYERDAVISYILDNYLFTYSMLNEESRITSKVTKGKLLDTRVKNRFFLGDRGHVQYLAIDTLNDKSILSCKDQADPEFSFEGDWRLFYNYFMEIYERYVEEIDDVSRRQIVVKTKQSEEVLPVLRFLKRPYKYDELVEISNYIDYVDPNDKNLQQGVYVYESPFASFSIPMQHVFAEDFYNKYLLDIYFAGLREESRSVQFKHFYNVIEYAFEDATVLECKKHLPRNIASSVSDLSDLENWRDQLDKKFRYSKKKLKAEETQLRIAINLLVDKGEFIERIETFDQEIKDHLLKPVSFVGKATIPPLDLSDPNLLDRYSTRIYSIRNAIIHTKRTLHGRKTSPILPFSKEERLLEKELPLLKYVAQRIILKEKEIFDFTSLSFSPAEIFLWLNLLSENKNYETLVKNLNVFLYNLSSKLNGTDYEKFLDQILHILVVIFDEIRLHDPAQLKRLGDKLVNTDLASYDKTTHITIGCLKALLKGEVRNFEAMVKKVPRFTMRANLYSLQNSLGLGPYSDERK